MSGQIFYVENDSLKLFIDLNKLIKTNAFLEFKIFKQKMYVSASNNLIEVDIKTQKTRYVENVSKDKETKTKGVKIINNSLWYIEYTNTKNYLIKFSEKNKEIDSTQNVTDIFKTKNHLFVNTDYILRTDLLCWNFKNQEFQPLINLKKTRKTRTVYIYEDSKSFLWLCTNKGVLQFKLEEGKMIELNTFFPDKFITRVIEDDNGNYWFSTLNNGVFIIPNLSITSYNKENSLIKKNKVTSLANDGINTVFYNKGKKNIGKFNVKTKIFSTHKVIDDALIEVNKISYVKKYKTLFVTGTAGGVNLIKEKKKTLFKTYYWKDFSVISDSTMLFSSMNKSTIINNICSLNKTGFSKSNTILTYKILREKRAYVNHYSKNKKIYIAYVDGLYIYDLGYKSKLITYKGKPIFISDIKETDDGVVWVSSINHGLLGLKDDKVIESYDKDSGLISNRINKIVTDGNDIWIVTKKGLQCIKREHSNPKIITIDKRDGLKTNEIFDITILKDKVYLGTTKGLLCLNKNNSYKNLISPTIFFEKITVSDIDEKIESNYKLNYDDNVTISFNSTSFFNPYATSNYKYRLKGLDKKWISTIENNVRYSSFPTGKFVFEVKSVNEDGVESEVVKRITFTVTPPYWKTTSFFLIVLVLLGILSFFIYKEQAKRIQKKRKIEIDVVNSKLTALKAQMNPHFMFNALNSIQKYILTNQKTIASDYLGRFADLMRIYLNHSTKDYITLAEEIETLRLYLNLEKIRFGEHFNYKINVDTSKVLIHNMKIPTLIIQPYIENAIKHGLLHKKENKVLAISFVIDGNNSDSIICIIEDNGIGRERSYQINKKRSKLHTSFASNAGKTRLELLNFGKEKQIVVDIIDLKNGTVAIGTKVILRIPYIS